MQDCLSSFSEHAKSKYPFIVEKKEKYDTHRNYVQNSNFNELLQAYLANSCFDCSIISTNAYNRPLRQNDISKIDFSVPITADEIFTNKNLIINKILLSIYEQDLLFLDSSFEDEKTRNDFKKFYDPNFVALGKVIKPYLEYLAFNFLEKEIEIIGSWNKHTFHKYLENIVNTEGSNESELSREIISTDSLELSAKIMLIQLSLDFLSEASAMARVLPGSFGAIQSELMKIFIDEYGYGVHNAKHSTLFEKTLSSVGLNKSIHHYYNDYLPTSFMVTNYFHYVCSNKSYWYKYLGALYFVEATAPKLYKNIGQTLQHCLDGVDTKYFDEHVHIDMHHRRMVLDKIIYPSIDEYGDKIIDDILIGFESFRLLLKIADDDLIRQVKFSDQLSKPNYIDRRVIKNESYLAELKGEAIISYIGSEDELLEVHEGELVVYASSTHPVNFKKNDKIFLPKGRLRSILPCSDKTSYMIQSVDIRS